MNSSFLELSDVRLKKKICLILYAKRNEFASQNNDSLSWTGYGQVTDYHETKQTNFRLFLGLCSLFQNMRKSPATENG